MMVRELPRWRSKMADPSRQLRPYRQRKKALSLPLYVLRWLNVQSIRRGHDDSIELTAQILINACHAHYTVHAGKPRFLNNLLCGKVHTGKESFYDDVCAGLQKPPGHDVIVCIDNTRYGYFFSLAEKERGEFMAWMWEHWPMDPPKKPGWPVIKLELGDWPVDPRLLPGSPLALACLEVEDAAILREAQALVENPDGFDDATQKYHWAAWAGDEEKAANWRRVFELFGTLWSEGGREVNDDAYLMLQMAAFYANGGFDVSPEERDQEEELIRRTLEKDARVGKPDASGQLPDLDDEIPF